MDSFIGLVHAFFALVIQVFDFLVALITYLFSFFLALARIVIDALHLG